LATTAKFTGALSRATLLPDRSVPFSVPLATTPLARARKLVILADNENLDDVAPLVTELGLAFADGAATSPAKASPTKPATTSLRIVSSYQ
jgi:hypothetical protein